MGQCLAVLATAHRLKAGFCTTANLKVSHVVNVWEALLNFSRASRQIKLSVICFKNIRLCLSTNPCQPEARATFGCFFALPICHLPGFPWLRKEAAVSLPTDPSSPPSTKLGHHWLDKGTVVNRISDWTTGLWNCFSNFYG